MKIEELAAALLALDGVEQCELAIELVLRNRRLADEIATTIYDALREDEISMPALMAGTATELVAE